MNSFKPVHIVHLLLYAPDTSGKKCIPIIGRTRLMKMIFLYHKELSEFFEKKTAISSFNFEAYNFGPFSRKVYEAISFLETRGIIKSEATANSTLMPPEDINIDEYLSKIENENNIYPDYDYIYYTEIFELTKEGVKIIEDKKKWFSWKNLDEEKKKKLIIFKTKMINTSLTNILKYVYSKYPKYAEKSFINHKLFPKS